MSSTSMHIVLCVLHADFMDNLSQFLVYSLKIKIKKIYDDCV